MQLMKKMPALFAAVALAFATTACDIDQTEAGEMPEVDIDAEAGEMPEYDVDVADVEVGTDTDTIVVETPTVDVDMPDDTLDIDSDDDGN